MKKIGKTALLLAVLLCAANCFGAAAVSLPKNIEVKGFDANFDYTAAIYEVLEDGSAYAMQIGAIYEKQRNLKIDALGMPYRKWDYFSSYSTAEEIKTAMRNDEAKEASAEAVSYTQSELDLLSRLIYAEAGCTWIPDWVQRMVGSVVLNRVESDYYPDTIQEVIYDEGQYSPTWDGSINKTPDARTIANARYILENGSICPENVTGQNSVVCGSGVYESYYDSVLDTTIYFCYF